MDSLDTTLTVGENLRIVEGILRKYDGMDIEVDEDYLEWINRAQEEQYREWLAEQQQSAKPRVHKPRQLRFYIHQGKYYIA
jgi:hypothetical protein